MLKVADSFFFLFIWQVWRRLAKIALNLLAQNTYCHLVAIEGIASLACAPFTIMLSLP